MPLPAAAPPALAAIVDDGAQRLLVRFASLSARAQRQGDPEIARRLDRSGLTAAATWLRAQHGPVPPPLLPVRPDLLEALED
ncbi:hypothetical protein EU555_33085 [Methylobacterium nonmethylotrophicum]|uniref:Uncharacterized protein n=1 Tax=Methylobacterium nonmethylotrophicum TaxID=1141884 RepID=A0A4Z0NDI0_9HYPH|nr:hypothetical protein EU555_33085 [Methylobacterium nonmethylotrophicum]